MQTTLIWTYSLLASLFVSLISLVGIIITPFQLVCFQKRAMGPLLAFAAGSLAGDAFIHIIPDSFNSEERRPLLMSVTMLSGIFFFFLVERHVEHLHGPLQHHDHHHHEGDYDDFMGCSEQLHEHLQQQQQQQSQQQSQHLQELHTQCSRLHEKHCRARLQDQQAQQKQYRQQQHQQQQQRRRQHSSANKVTAYSRRAAHSVSQQRSTADGATNFVGSSVRSASARLNISTMNNTSVIVNNQPQYTNSKNFAYCSANKNGSVKIAPIGWLNLLADAFHNFVDGVAIGISFSTSFTIGLSTSIAIVLHEVPQEFGDFAILIHAGFTKRRALLLNLLTALFSCLGTIVGVLVGSRFESSLPWILGFVAGGFLYIALADTIHVLHSMRGWYHTFSQFVFICAGVGIMALLTLIEDD